MASQTDTNKTAFEALDEYFAFQSSIYNASKLNKITETSELLQTLIIQC